MKLLHTVASATLGLALAASLTFAPRLYASPEDPAHITLVRLEADTVVVAVQVPSGIRKVTLESRLRLGPGAWEPRAVARVDGEAGEVTFRLPKAANLEVLRVRTEATEPLPDAFYQGTNTYRGQPDTGGYGYRDFLAPGLEVDATAGATGSQSREVVESDIWKRVGDVLYFFNQYRGLQIIDVRDPDHARVTGTIALPAAGEQMYVTTDQRVVLLAQDGCGWGPTGPLSKVVVVETTGDQPKIAAELPLDGQIRESRMVGTALYVASDTYRQVPGSGDTYTWEWSTRVTSFDLAPGAAPQERQTLWFAGYGNTVTATDRYLFVAVTLQGGGSATVVHCVDITSAEGAMAEREQIRTAGPIQDKFKMRWENGIFTAISEAWSFDGTRTVWATRLENFRLPDPASAGPLGVVKLGELALGHGERLFATRFAGDRAYIVTFEQIDPLWIVDLSDPTKPAIYGELEVPGWSTYIHPIGDRLVTVGIDNLNGWRAAVSLFDVRDPAHPALLSRVSLGDQYSWSEANSDEKAFSVLADEGLILLPVQGGWNNGYASRVQLVDLDLAENNLALRGVIEHRFQPRRTMAHADRILSLSGTELLSVDVTNRDQPAVLGQLELAWPADRVFVHESWLISLATTAWEEGLPSFRISLAADPNQLLQTLVLPTDLPVLSADLRDGRFYVVQGQVNHAYYPPEPEPGDPPPPGDRLVLSIYDLSVLPEDAKLLGKLETSLEALGYLTWLDALWPKPNLLVLASGGDGGGYYYPWMWRGPWLVDGLWGGPAIGMPYYWGGQGGRILAFDVADPAAPRFLSDVDLTGESWRSFSRAFTAKGLVYLSHSESVPAEPIVATDPASGQTRTYYPPDGQWVRRYWLDVIDYTEPRDPLVRRPIPLPGLLQGISHEGAIVYTTGGHWKPDSPWTADGQQWLDAGAYDEVSVRQLDSLPLPNSWPQALSLAQGVVWLSQPADATASGSLLASWALDANAEFVRLSETEVKVPVSNLRAFGTLLAAQADREVRLFDIAQPAEPRFLAKGGPDGCVWPNLGTAAGIPGRGVWLPLGVYGVSVVPIPAGP